MLIVVVRQLHSLTRIFSIPFFHNICHFMHWTVFLPFTDSEADTSTSSFVSCSLSLFLKVWLCVIASGNLTSKNFCVSIVLRTSPTSNLNTHQPRLLSATHTNTRIHLSLGRSRQSSVFKLSFKLGTRSLIELHTTHLVRYANQLFPLFIYTILCILSLQPTHVYRASCTWPINIWILVKNHSQLYVSVHIVYLLGCTGNASIYHPVSTHLSSDYFIKLHVHRYRMLYEI